tara:strand:- start:216 stop:737 length:522 start_codon:yes stop_codon:yes gene_type:complete
MNISRQIKYNGASLEVYGKYLKATTSEEGSIPVGAEFTVLEVYDISNPKMLKLVTDLYTDLNNELETEVLISLQDEGFDEEQMDVSEELFEEFQSSLESMCSSTPLEYIYSELDKLMPILWSDDIEEDIRTVSAVEINQLAITMNDEENPIIASRVSLDGVRFIRMNDLNQIK